MSFCIEIQGKTFETPGPQEPQDPATTLTISLGFFFFLTDILTAELVVRTTHLMLAVETSAQAGDGQTGKALIFGRFASPVTASLAGT